MKLVSVVSAADGTYTATFEAADLTDVIHLLAAAGGPTLTEALNRMERHMATAAQKLDELERAVDAFDEREALEDAEHTLSRAEVTRLQNELRVLQDQLDAGSLTPEQEARMDALIARVKASNVIPDEVLPGEG